MYEYTEYQLSVLKFLKKRKRPYRVPDICYYLNISKASVNYALNKLILYGDVVKNTESRNILYAYKAYAHKILQYKDIRITSTRNLIAISSAIHKSCRGLTVTDLYNLLGIPRQNMYGALKIMEIEGEIAKIFDPIEYTHTYFSLKNQYSKKAYMKAMEDSPEKKILLFLVLGPKTIQSIAENCFGNNRKAIQGTCTVLNELVRKNKVKIRLSPSKRRCVELVDDFGWKNIEHN